MSKQKFTMPTGEVVEREFPVWKTPYNHDTNFESDRTAFYSTEASMTKQEFKEETDINFLLDRFMKGGEAPPLILPEHFADISNRQTYFDTARQVAEAAALFYQLDADTRGYFLNDPNRWADAVVKAVETGDREFLEHMGIETRKPEEGEQGTPRTSASPAANAAQTPPPAPSQGAKPPGDLPADKTQNAK